MSPRFEVSDKVVLSSEFGEFAAGCTVPKMIPGRVYCVLKVNYVRKNWWVHLVGLRMRRTACYDGRGISTLCLRRVGAQGSAPEVSRS